MADNAKRDQNRALALLVQDTAGLGTVALTGVKLTDASALYVAIVDGNGDQITSFGGGTQYAELATTTDATGTLGLGRYLSSLPTLTTGQMNEPMLDASSIMMMNNAYKLDSTNDSIAVYQATASNLLAQVSVISGGIASGAIASGAIASGAAVSGAFADGSLVTLGAKADAKSMATDTTAVTIMQVLKEISYMEQNPATQAVTGTFWQTTQPVSLASLPALAAGSNLIGQIEIYDGSNVIGTSSHPVRTDPVGTTTQPVTKIPNGATAISGLATATGTSDTAVIAAQGTGKTIYITSVSVVNTGATTSLITIETDTASAKTAMWYLINPAGGGDNITFDPPLVATASNKNVGFVAGSSSSTQYVSFNGYYL